MAFQSSDIVRFSMDVVQGNVEGKFNRQPSLHESCSYLCLSAGLSVNGTLCSRPYGHLQELFNHLRSSWSQCSFLGML